MTADLKNGWSANFIALEQGGVLEVRFQEQTVLQRSYRSAPKDACELRTWASLALSWFAETWREL